MNLRELLENIERTGKGDTAVIGWGRGLGHKGHMMLASSVITHAKELGADPYFVVSRTFGPDDPLKPEEKLAIYKKVFPEQGHIFQTASDELPDLTRVLTNLNQQGYRNAVVVVGADQVKAFQYLNAYNGKPNKAGDIPFNFDKLDVISRQMTNDPSREEEGPRATPMRQVLQDPTKSEEEQFAVWRDAMSDNIPDEEVRDLMLKAKQRMQELKPAPKKAPAKKKEPAIAEGHGRYWCSTDKKWKERKGPKQTRNTKEDAVPEASYKGNIGIMELIKFFTMAKDKPELIKRVKELVAAGEDREVWKIVQNFTGTKLVGKEFSESIRESISREYQRLKKLNG